MPPLHSHTERIGMGIGILMVYGLDTLAVVVLFTHAACLQHVLVLGHDGRYPNGGS